MSDGTTITCAMQCHEKCHSTIIFPDTSSIVKHIEDVAISGWTIYGKTAICPACRENVSAGERRNVDVARVQIEKAQERVREYEKLYGPLKTEGQVEIFCHNCDFDLEHTTQKNCPQCSDVLPLSHQERQGFELVKKAPKVEGLEEIVLCIKCRHTVSKVIYIWSKKPKARDVLQEICCQACPDHAHLHIICVHCGYGFAEECADHVMDAGYEVTDDESGEGEGRNNG